MIDPHFWWYVTRASGIIAWALLTLSVVWGVLLATKLLRRVAEPARLEDLHRFLGLVALIMTGLHVVSLMLDGWLHLTLQQALVPGMSPYRTLPVAIGIVSMYLVVIVYLTSLVRKRLPRRFWKALHYFSYVAALGVALHAGLTGTDAGRPWYLSAAAIILTLTAVAAVVRVVSSGGARRSAPVQDVSVDGAPAAISSSPALGAAPQQLVVSEVAMLADSVRGFRMIAADLSPLPEWQPGAHLTVQLGNGLTRQYSLCGDPANRTFYEIAVLREPQSRGGADWMHDYVRPGARLVTSAPQNHFRLVPALDYLFIAGGIGITPIRSMILSLPAHRSWRLIYLGATSTSMAYLDDLVQRFPDRVYVHSSAERGRLELSGLLATTNAQVYCCGPATLISAVEEAVPATRFHTERFEPIVRSASANVQFEVEAARSRRRISVAAGESVLAALEAGGIEVAASCREGVCGSCELRVLRGSPMHLDSVLADDEKDELGVMYPCVSRAHSPQLVLDI